MCKYKDSDCYCVIAEKTCDQKSCEECEIYHHLYEEFIRE